MNIKKALVLLLVLLALVFGYLKWQAAKDADTAFGRDVRLKLGKYVWARSVLGLHRAGDARNWYFSGTGPIAVTVVRAENVSLSEMVQADFAAVLAKAAGRPTQLFNAETIRGGSLAEEDLNAIVDAKRKKYLPGQPDLFVIYAEDFAGGEYEAARTLGEFGVVLSHKKLAGAAFGTGEGLDQSILAAMLHELGHQLGLGHNSRNGCIMEPQVENPRSLLRFGSRYAPAKFCEQEEKQLEAARQASLSH